MTFTPREPIEKLITTLVNNGAQSVGVDIDFSPMGGEFVDPGDPEFLRVVWSFPKNTTTCRSASASCARKSNLIAGSATIVTCGWRRRSLPSGVAHGEAIHWTRHKNGPPLPEHERGARRCRRLRGYQRKTVWSWAVESTSVVETKTDVHSAVSAIDSSPLQRIKEDKLPALDPAAFEEMKDKIENRIVLLGDYLTATD